MTTAEKSEIILRKMLDLANQKGGGRVTLEHDWGDFTATIFANGQHTHVGVPDGNWESFVDSLHDALTGGPGLSWS